MVSTESIKLTDESREKLIENIAETKRFLDRKFPKFSIGLAVFVLFIILLLISQYEDYGFSVLLKIATIFPLTGIFVVLISYFHKRGSAKRIKKFYERILMQGSYEVMRVNSSYCSNYIDGLSHYFLFNFDKERKLLLRINDFSVNRDRFPNDNFTVPPYELSDIVGNEIICEGNVINCNQYDKIEQVLPAFMVLPAGQVMITRKI